MFELYGYVALRAHAVRCSERKDIPSNFWHSFYQERFLFKFIFRSERTILSLAGLRPSFMKIITNCLQVLESICDQSSKPSSFLLCVGYSYHPWFFVTLHFSHDRSNLSPPPFSSTTFQNFPCISVHFPTCSIFRNIPNYIPNVAFY
jgi:hypothetical protein